MYFDNLSAALTMDGHGVFVWSAYLIATVAIALILALPRRKERKILLQLAGEIRRQQTQTESPTGQP
jgi:heme exporter protein D